MLALLQSILAFVLTMLGMATIVTILMEAIARFTRRRGRIMRHVLRLLFEKEIRRTLSDKPTQEKIDRTIKVVLSSPLRLEASDNRFFRLVARAMKYCLGADQSTELTARDVMVRLSRTELGSELVEAAKDEWAATVERIEQRFDELAAAASEWFKNSSAIGSLAIGIVLAFAFNFDGLRVIEFYLDNPSKAEAVTAQADAIIDRYDEAQAKLGAALEPSDPPDPDTSETNLQTEAKASLQELSAALEAVKSRHSALIGEGLPIGFGFFPWCYGMVEGSPPDPRCLTEGTQFGGLLIFWAVVTLITGVLIGLGGPFWYNIATGLLQLTQVMRGRKPASGAETGAAEARPRDGPITTEKLLALFEARKKENDDVPEQPRAAVVGKAEPPTG